MVAIIDYDAGNVKSVEKAVESLGYKAVLTREKDKILAADHVILPGVGNFGACMDKITQYGLVDVIKQIVDKKTPFLGICVGLQLLFESSEESPGVAGLGLLKGKILRLPDKEGLKIPNIGWNNLKFKNKSRLFNEIKEGEFLYFVHSYYLCAQDEEIVSSTIEYGTTIHASIERDNVFATQFHPEKSSEIGLKILKNFLEV